MTSDRVPAKSANRRAMRFLQVSAGGAYPRRPPYHGSMPGPHRHRILLWMCALIAINQLGFGAVVPVLPLYARAFGVTQSAIGLAIAVYGLARLLVAVPTGRLADRLGRRAGLAAGGLVTAAGNLLCAYAPTYAALVAARFLAGAGACLVVTTGQIVLADITTPADRGRVMA